MTVVGASEREAGGSFYPHQRRLARVGNRLVAAVDDGTQVQFLWSSTGGTWVDYEAPITGWRQGSFAVYKDAGNVWRLVTVWRQTGTHAGRTSGTIWAIVGTFSSDLSELTYGTPVAFPETSTNNWAPDIDMVADGLGGVGLVVVAESAATAKRVRAAKISVSSSGVPTFAAAQVIGGPYPAANSQRTYPSVAIDPATKDVGVYYSTGEVFNVVGSQGYAGSRFRKGVFASGSWTWRTDRLITSHLIPTLIFDRARMVTCRWNPVLGGWVMAGPVVWNDAGGSLQTRVWLQPHADDLVVPRLLFVDVTPEAQSNGSAAVDPATGDVWLVGSEHEDLPGDAAAPLTARRLIPAANGTLADGGTSTIDASTDIWAVSAFGELGGLHLLYGQDDGPNYAVVYQRVPLNQPPNAPNVVYPTGSITINAAQAQRFDWTFSDVDGLDVQSAYELRYQVVGAGSWTTTGWVTSPTSHRDFAANTFIDGDDYEWQVRVKDSAGLIGPWSESAFFSAAGAPTDLTLLAPANGSTVGAQIIASWSISDQDSFQVRVLGDLSGTPNESDVVYDTGEVVDPAQRSWQLNFPASGLALHVQVRAKDDGIWSEWESVQVATSFALPGAATLVLRYVGVDGQPTDDPSDAVGLWFDITNLPGEPDPLAPPGSGDDLLLIDIGGDGGED